MTKITPQILDQAFLGIDTPMFSEIMKQIEDDERLSATRRRDFLSGLRNVAKALNRQPASVPADGRWLQPRLAKIEPVALGVSQKTWSNTLSNARAAMAHCGILERRKKTSQDLDPNWRPLWKIALAADGPTQQPALGRFVYFLNMQGIAPEKVSDVHASAYLEALKINEISKSPDVAYRAAVNGWNLATRRLPEWPQQQLTLPSRRKRIALPLEDYPESFQADLEAFLYALGPPRPIGGAADSHPRRPSTITQYHHRLMRFAAALVRAGVEIADIETLGTLVQPTLAERGLRQLLQESDNKVTQSISATANLLQMIARHHRPVSAQDLKAIERLKTKLTLPRQVGMTDKNRDRLRPLQDPATLRRLVTLPEAIFSKTDKIYESYTTALACEDALAIGILLYAPIRCGNLAAIDIERNLQRPGDGRVFLVFEGQEVKNGRRIEFELPQSLVAMLDRHLALRAPLLCPHGTRWLFPRRDGVTSMNQSQLARRLGKRIRREVGITMNPHLFRHMAAMVWLDAHPGAYEAARRLLGHSSLSQTLSVYSGFESGTATRLFAEVVEKARTT